jgi:hypothetical protein
MLQNVQNLKKMKRLGLTPQKSTKNLERHGFLDLPQFEQWKRRSCFEDHVSEVEFEIGSFNLQGSRRERGEGSEKKWADTFSHQF